MKNMPHPRAIAKALVHSPECSGYLITALTLITLYVVIAH